MLRSCTRHALHALLALLALLPACASSTGTRVVGGIAPELSPGELDRARHAAVQTGDGRAASWTQMVEACFDADAVLIAERHGFGPGLCGAAALWADLLDARDRAGTARQPALALEFWERDHQVRLDDYLSGVTDEAGLIRAMGWSGARADAAFPPGHRAMVQAAVRSTADGRAVPVIAANAPRRYVRLARLEGFDRLNALNERQRALFRVPDRLVGGRYREDFERVMGGDPASPSHDDMYRSQQVWDWTMAESVADAITQGHRRVVLVVGAFHVEHEGGLLQALRELRPGVRVVRVSFLDSRKTEEPVAGRHAEAGADTRAVRADFVIDFAR